MSENDTIPKKSTSQINKAVFFTSALLIFLLVAFAAVFPDVADKNFKLLQQQIFTNASWFYILALNRAIPLRHMVTAACVTEKQYKMTYSSGTSTLLWITASSM